MDARNPFEPPQAHVDDPIPPTLERPAPIDRAFWMIIGSGALGLVNYLIPGLRASPLMMAFTLAWVVGFAFLLRAGQNWARIVFLIFFVLGCVAMLFIIPTLLRFGLVRVAIVGVQTALQGYATWLVFSPPGSLWFHRLRRMRS
jgi:hypothetical protein